MILLAKNITKVLDWSLTQNIRFILNMSKNVYSEFLYSLKRLKMKKIEKNLFKNTSLKEQQK